MVPLFTPFSFSFLEIYPPTCTSFPPRPPTPRPHSPFPPPPTFPPPPHPPPPFPPPPTFPPPPLLFLSLPYHQRPFSIERGMSNDEIASSIKRSRPSASIRWDQHTCDLLKTVRTGKHSARVCLVRHVPSRVCLVRHVPSRVCLVRHVPSSASSMI